MANEVGKVVGDTVAKSAAGTTATAPMSKTDSILAIIQLALQGLTLFVPGTAEAGLAVGILTHALAAWHAETGQPIDLTKIPNQARV